METSKLLALVVLTGAFVSVNSLQCYECIDCPDASSLKDEWLKTCGGEETTIAPTTAATTTGLVTTVPVEPTITTAVPVDPTAATTPGPVTPTAATTLGPVTPTAATTPGPVTPTAATTPGPINPTAATTAAPVDPTAATTAGPINPTAATTAGPVNPTDGNTAAPVDPTAATTAGPVNPTAATTAGPINPTAATTAGPTDANTAASDLSGGVYSASPRVTRVRRNVLRDIVRLDNECRCYGEPCPCEDPAEEIRAFQYADTEVSFVCAKANVKNETGVEVVVRGCAPAKVLDKEFCTFFAAEANATGCSTCTTDRCNNGFALQNSIAVILLVFTLVLFIK